jgi:hypothetical protein
MKHWIWIDSETLVNLDHVTSIYIDTKNKNEVNFSVYQEGGEAMVFTKKFTFPNAARDYFTDLMNELEVKP